jgi:hypothetical protein
MSVPALFVCADITQRGVQLFGQLWTDVTLDGSLGFKVVGMEDNHQGGRGLWCRVKLYNIYYNIYYNYTHARNV